MDKIIIGLTGEPASGKGTVVKYLQEKYGASSHRFSTPLRDVLNRLHLEVGRKNMQDISIILRNHFGQDLLAKIISEDAANDPNKIIIVDGVRRPADIEHLKKLPEFKLIYITTDMKTRYERLIQRGENTDDLNKTFEQFTKEHEVETEANIPTIGKTADFTIDNSKGLEELYAQIDNILK